MRVFLSYTSELATYPEKRSFVDAAKSAINKTGHACFEMRDFTAENAPSSEACIREVSSSDLFVCLVGFKYGSPVVDQPEVSYTELEYDTASDKGMQRLIFALHEDTKGPAWLFIDPTYGPRQFKFRQKIQNELLIRSVSNADQLEFQLYLALRQIRPEIINKPCLPPNLVSGFILRSALFNQARQYLLTSKGKKDTNSSLAIIGFGGDREINASHCAL